MSNPWDQSSTTRPTTQYRQPSGRSRSTVTVLIGVVALLTVAAIGGVGWLLWSSGIVGSSSPAAPAGGVVVVQSTVVESRAAEAEPTQTSTLRTTTTRTTTAAPSRSTEESREPQIPGLLADGWNDNTVTRCASGERLMFAGRGDDAWVTVCEGRGGLTYRSWIFGGHLTEQATRTGRDSFVVDTPPSRIVVDSNGVTIFTDGSLAASEPLHEIAVR